MKGKLLKIRGKHTKIKGKYLKGKIAQKLRKTQKLRENASTLHRPP